MDKIQSDRCGYTYPKDYNIGEVPNHQSCCYRKSLPDNNNCAWHAELDETEHKNINELKKVRAPKDIREKNNIIISSPLSIQPECTELLDGADLSGMCINGKVSLTDVSLRGADLSNSQLNDSNLSNSIFNCSKLNDSKFWKSNLSNTHLFKTDLSNSNFLKCNFSNSTLVGAQLSETNLRESDMTDINSIGANFQNANLPSADLSNSFFRDTNFTNATLRQSKLSNSDLTGSDLYKADLERAKLNDTNLQSVDLTQVVLEQAVLVRTNLFDATLHLASPHGATFNDVQINDDTTFRLKNNNKWWRIGFLRPRRRCVYDPKCADINEYEENELNIENNISSLAKAADTYKKYEELGRDNSLPRLQREMFVLRQDIQRKRAWESRDIFNWAFAQVSRTTFKYGESLGRIAAISAVIIITFAISYSEFSLVRNNNGAEVSNFVDALYFSTLTFTTSGLGDFQPVGETGRALVTAQAVLGAILIAIFVFVLGRRAAR